MKREPKQLDGLPSLSTILALMVPYGLFLAALYLTAYWSPLGLKPFQYANAADLSSATLAGLATAFIGLAIGVTIGYVVARFLPAPSDRAGKIVAVILFVGAVVAIPLLWMLWANPAKWFVIGLFASFIAVPLLLAIPFFSKLIENDQVRPIVVLAIAYMPAFMYGYGAKAADEVMSIDRGMQLDHVTDGLGIDSGGQIKYAGMLGEYHVVFEPQNKRTTLIPGDRVLTILPTKAK